MSKRPAFQFYPADWRNNANLRRCSEAARGAWMDVLCLLHDSDEYGVLRWPLADIAQAAGVNVKLVQELSRKSVLKGGDSHGAAYVFTPSHAGKQGDPVTLVESGEGPCWYCSRFVRDEYVRQRRGANSRFDTDNNPKPKATPKPPIGEHEGYGASSSSSASKKQSPPKPPTGGCDRFTEFWRIYPQKVAKPQCERKWRARRLDDIADLILVNVAERLQCDPKWQEGYVPNPLTYLNQERWNDPIPRAPPKHQGRHAASLMALEGTKYDGLAEERDSDGASEALLPWAGGATRP